MLEKRYLNMKDLTVYIGLSRFTVYDLIEQREIPFIKIRTGLRFDIKAIDEWMAKRATKTIKSS